MPIMINDNVERIVSDENVAKYQAMGYKLLNAKKATEEKKTKNGQTPTENVNIEPEGTQASAEPPKEPEKDNDGAATPAENTQEPAAGSDGTDQAAQSTDYEAMNVADLRKVAKEMGVQGYGNMNRATLLAVIAAH